jgi:hypothetical protein
MPFGDRIIVMEKTQVTKYCKRCDTVKPINEFGYNAARPDKKQSYCLICCRKESKKQNDKNKAEGKYIGKPPKPSKADWAAIDARYWEWERQLEEFLRHDLEPPEPSLVDLDDVVAAKRTYTKKEHIQGLENFPIKRKRLKIVQDFVSKTKSKK